ncbi:hypothetical protein ABMA27_015764 [Loxostege sticticalis]|uniref:Uncharacterized protein n=1 Tax=Loxostege sticticalis TaxID=481309 RepID=A0ABR3I491_LOXSC
MGKRRYHDDEEDYLAQKMRKLQRKMAKVRRRRQKSSSSSDEISESDHYALSPEASIIADAPSQEPIPPDESKEPEIIELDPGPSEPLELAPEVLSMLGDAPEKEDVCGPSIHKDIACRWTEILKNGLKEESIKNALKSHELPENLRQIKAPKLNPEIKAAVNENVIKRDLIIAEKQNLLSCTITNIANILSSVLSENRGLEVTSDIIKSLSETGKLLCHLQYSETMTRKKFLLACLNKEVRDNIKDVKHDHMLFGEDLQEKLKSMKAISKAGAELRSVISKPKTVPKSKQHGETSRSLNWRGPPPPPPPPRRGAARQSSTAGGRKQQQPARRPANKQTTRLDNKAAYRR